MKIPSNVVSKWLEVGIQASPIFSKWWGLIVNLDSYLTPAYPLLALVAHSSLIFMDMWTRQTGRIFPQQKNEQNKTKKNTLKLFEQT